MANGGVTVDDMRYAEYTPKTTVRSDTDIDRRLVSICFYSEVICGASQTKPGCFLSLCDRFLNDR